MRIVIPRLSRDGSRFLRTTNPGSKSGYQPDAGRDLLLRGALWAVVSSTALRCALVCPSIVFYISAEIFICSPVALKIPVNIYVLYCLNEKILQLGLTYMHSRRLFYLPAEEMRLVR